MGDWADTKAREWLEMEAKPSRFLAAELPADRLAALLREVREEERYQQVILWKDRTLTSAIEAKAGTLAEVRRVVGDVQKTIWGSPTDEGSAVTLCCSEILSRLEALK